MGAGGRFGFPLAQPNGVWHAAARLLVSSSANVKIVQKQLGHKSAAMNRTVYAELFDDDLDTLVGFWDVVKFSSYHGFGHAVWI